MLLLFTGVSVAQVVFHFGAGGAVYNSSTTGYEMSGVGTYFRSTSGGTVSDGTTNCNGYTPSKATSSSLFIFKPDQPITKLTISGTGTGSNRTFSSCSTARSLNGTYTVLSGTIGSGTIQSGVCGTIEITFPAAIAAGTYLRIVLSGNVNITSLTLTLEAQPPTVSTIGVTNIATESAVVNAVVTSDGGSAVTERGVCWNTIGFPTVSDYKNIEGSGTGSYSSTLTGLTPGEMYYVRAYAINENGISYGNEVSFATLAAEPTIQSAISFGSVTGNSIEVNFSGGDGARRIVLAKAGAEVDSEPVDGNSYVANAAFGNGSEIGNGNYVVYDSTGNSVTVTNLLAGTTYHFAVFEYNVGAGASQNYLTVSPGRNSQMTLSEPSLIATPFSYNFGKIMVGTSAQWSYTLTGSCLQPSSGSIIVTAPEGYSVSLAAEGPYSSTCVVMYEGGIVNATIYVRFSPVEISDYNSFIINNGGSAAVTIAVSGNGVLYDVGDYASVANGNWGSSSTWRIWNGSGWDSVATAQPTQNNNVWILGGYTITLEASPKLCKNLYVINGTLRSGSLVNSPRYIGIYGQEIIVEQDGILGDTTTGDNANGLSLDIFSNNLSIKGNGGIANISRLRINAANTNLVIDRDLTLNYHGSANAGNAFAYYVTSTTADNGVLTINEGKTLTFAPWACLACSSSSHSTMAVNHTINVNGTLLFLPGQPDPDTNTTVNGWAGHDSYLSMGVTEGKSFTLNIGSNGIVVVQELYPNGTKSDNSPGSGAISVINIASGGMLKVEKIADFRNALQMVKADLLLATMLFFGSAHPLESMVIFNVLLRN